MSLTLRRDQSLISKTEVITAFLEVCCSVDTPVSLAQYILAKNKEFDQLVTRKFNPLHYLSASEARGDYLVLSILSKADFLDTTFDRDKAAMSGFYEAERACKITNVRFELLSTTQGAQALCADNPKLWAALQRAKSIVRRILGPVPQDIRAHFGPGVTQVVKKFVTSSRKYSENTALTKSMLIYLPDIVGPVWFSNLHSVEVVEGMHVNIVPKNAKTGRTIGVEPDLNGYVQLGFGSYLRQRFKPYVDLAHGQEWNRFLASMAHQWGLSTVDLKSASDTISTGLVRYLLDDDWFDLLDTCRSRSYRLEGENSYTPLEKFSSMGNGFTFELESIIFYALTRAVGSSRALTTTYGDDIICERAVFDDLSEILSFCGFTVNGEKTFRDGLFFESCGEDYFDGENIRPFFWKKLGPVLLYKMINDVSRYASHGNFRDIRYLKPFAFLMRIAARYPSVPIPQGYGNVGVVTDFDVAVRSGAVRKLRNGHCGFSTRALKYRSMEDDSYLTKVRGYLSSLDRTSFISSPHHNDPVLDDLTAGNPAFNIYPDRSVRSISDAKSIKSYRPEGEPVRRRGVFSIGRFNTFGCWVGFGPWV